MSAVDLTKTPVLPPPPGMTSNFVNPPSRVTMSIPFVVILPVISLIFVSARIYTQAKIARKLYLDDYLSMIAMFWSIALSVVFILRLPHGFGKHMWDVPLSDFVPGYSIYFIVSAECCVMITIFGKLAILFFYRRIFGVNKKFLIANDITSFIVFAVYVASFFQVAFACIPFKKLWDREVPGRCINLNLSAITSTIFNMITDIAILILPMPMIWHLKLAPRLKIGLSIVFALGSSTLALSAVRVWSAISYANDPDVSWTIITWDIATLFEYNGIIICGCLPILKALLQRMFPRLLPESLFGSLNHSGDHSGNRRGSKSQFPSQHEGKSGRQWIKGRHSQDMELGTRSSAKKHSSSTMHSTSEEGLVIRDGEPGIMREVEIQTEVTRAR